MLTQYLTPRNIPIWAGLLSAVLLIGAWTFQYGLGYAPCQMCYWQRHAHKAVLVLALIGIIMRFKGSKDMRLINGLLILALLGSAALAFWHMGVEYKWWEGPKTCLAEAVNLDDIRSGADLLSSLDTKIKAPGCSEAAWRFIGLSMAGWNMVISALGAIGILFYGLGRQKKHPA